MVPSRRRRAFLIIICQSMSRSPSRSPFIACLLDRKTPLKSVCVVAPIYTSRRQPLITSRITWSTSPGRSARSSTAGHYLRSIASFRFRSGVESSGTPCVDPFPRLSADASGTPSADRRRLGGRGRALHR